MDMISDRLQYMLSMAAGTCIGAFIALIVDAALFEIGESAIFACIFGTCLVIIGGTILWRVKPQRGDKMTRWRMMVMVFSGGVLVSGLFCFLLKKDWLVSLSPDVKLPMYSMLGTSLCFALTFSVVDILNNTSSCAAQAPHNNVPMVQSSKQVYVVLISSLFMGFLFGLSFGLIDVEDDTRLHTRLDYDQAVNTAIGAVVGALMGGANQYLRDKQLLSNAPYVEFSLDDCGT
mmetsp:Transcript_38735/g.95313  ORF Transcript_38735/g.95313 Transcript_38735/m.95313 type:complete len:232 (+) Transcript_38735:182-877(+)